MNKAKHIIRIAVLTLFTMFVFSLFIVGFNTVFSPKCISCHVGPKAKVKISTTHAAHQGTKCVSCHAGNGFINRTTFAAQVTYSMIIPVFHSENFDADSSYDSKCQSCHKSLSGVVQNNGLRIEHSKCAANTSCVRCHGNTGHTVNDVSNSVTYTMDDCFTCHKDISSDKKCTLCHEGRSSQAIKSTSSWQITHGPNWKQTHGMGNLNTCSVCHAQKMCATCHGAGVPHQNGFFAEHGNYAQKKNENCVSCHETSFCSDCHNGYEMPHPKDFLQTHSSVAKKDVDPSCLVCHAQSDCTDCHAKHIHPGGAETSYQKAKGGR